MTTFEQMLLDNGYIKYILNCKSMKFEKAKGHILSTMSNLDHIYFHKDDLNVLQKINDGKSIMDKDFTSKDRKGEICFGLHEVGKPPTLISPRPRIKVKRIMCGKEYIETEKCDNSMNIVLSKYSSDEIYKAMYNKNICFEIDLTINN